MKRRLISLVLTALVIMTMAVVCFADLGDMTWTHLRTFSTTDGGFDIPVAHDTEVKLIYAYLEGQFQYVSSDYPLNVIFIITRDGEENYIQYQYRIYEQTVQSVDRYTIPLPAFEVSPGDTWNITYTMIGGYEGFGEISFYSSIVDVSETSEAYQNGYNAGIIKGQEDADIASGLLGGFFDGLSGFVSSFTSIGVGNLTIGSMLGIMVITLIVVIIVKVVRG